MSSKIVSPQERVLLYDGVCALCNRAVRLVLKHDPGGQLLFTPIDGAYAAALYTRHPALRDVDSIILVTRDHDGTENIAVGSEAAISLAEYLGGGWNAASALRLFPRKVRDAAYDLVARSRYRIFGKFETCPLPAADTQHRFLP